LSQFSYMVERR